MDEFELRQRSAETAFAFDAAQEFRVRIAALRKWGLWAAQTAGLDAAQAEAQVARAMEGADDETLIAEVAAALKSAGISEHRVRAKLAACQQEARGEIQG